MKVIRTTTNADLTREVIVDNEDGTGTVTVYDAHGEAVEGWGIELPTIEPAPKTPLEVLAELPEDQASAGLTALVGLLMRTGEIWEGVYQMPNDDPAKAPMVPIAEVLLVAALPLIEE